tara:strand:+ start:5278 stop:6360 length:1083 start_codon:yes stop_codon:yes gene_type:complete
MSKLHFLFCFLLSGPLYCQLTTGSSFSNLEIFGSARILALGSSSAAHPGDVSFTALNPAAINESHINQWSITSQAAIGGLRRGSLTVGLPLPKKWSNKIKNNSQKILNSQKGGLNLKTFNFFMAAGVDYNHSGQLERRDVQGNQIGFFTARELTPRVALNAQFGPFSFGFGAKLPIISYDTFTSQAISTDYAFQWTADSARKQIVLLMRNVGWNIEYFAQQREMLPFDLQISFSQKLRYAPFRYNIAYTHIEHWDLKYLDPQLLIKDPITGLEFYLDLPWYNNLLRHLIFSVEAQLGRRIYFQLGYDFRRQIENRIQTRRVSAGISSGIMFKGGKNSFQYGSSLFNVAGRINQFSLIRNF